MTNNWFKTLFCVLLSASTGAAFADRQRAGSDSIRAVASDETVQAIRAATASELAEPMTFNISLAMTHLDELQARLNAGENLANGRITQAEMDARYLPSAADYQKVVSWLTASGFAIVQNDVNRTTVTAKGATSLVAAKLGVDFARITTADGDFTSAIDAPTLPSALPDSVIAVDGLQPHIRAHHHLRRIRRDTITTSSGLYIGPADIRSAYGATSTMTGSGQTIAIINDSYAVSSDLTQFWTGAGVSQSTSNITNVPVGAGPSANPEDGSLDEASLDEGYTSSIAPSAHVRMYGVNSLSFSNVATALVAIANDHASIPSISVVSMSFGGVEDALSQGGIRATSQALTTLAAEGVSVVAASGDDGSRPDPTLTYFGYEVNDAKSVDYPASDPNCTGIGGTNLTFTGASSSTLSYSSETTWSEIPANPVQNTSTAAGAGYGASGGGISVFFTKPSWQTDGNALLASETMRCVPDVSAISVGTFRGGLIPAEVILGGTDEGVEGTSLAAPVWAAMVAIVNQARASASQSVVGLLNPVIYPLSASGSFHDITTGNNGDYSAIAGYDMATGLGTPILPTLLSLLSGVAPAITTSSSSLSVQEGTTATFTAAASGSPTPTYQWQRKASGASSFSAMSDSTGVYSGTATATLTVQSPTTAMSGDQFECVATNALGTATSNAATLTVTAKPAAASSGGGGGGAVSDWFLGALGVLVALRLAQARHRPLAA